ncbi:MAG TPA: sulfatase-like hydrolase/transferase, partial [Chthoniobacterales bacterium]|nr:sulfatase-like hydrolase/transferase [Chthoniobacterales bacterium]
FVVTGCAAIQLLAPGQVLAAKNRQPNIIFILADDLGLDSVSCYGADQLKTPNIDALARDGTRFEYSYANPLCGPSRAQILTGRYPFRTGMTSNTTGDVMKPANEVMIPKVLKAAGYVTAEVGKWSQLPLQPGDWGFDEYLRFPGSGRFWRAQTTHYNVNGRTKDLPPRTYLPDLMHDFLVDFIKRHKDQPFYVHYAMSHVHGPIVRTPDTVPGRHHLFADNIAYMDKLVGKLVRELDRMGLRENTLIVFVGDNGTTRRAARRLTLHGRAINGVKGTMLEGGSRVPLIANWKGTTPAGQLSRDLTDFSDFFPTFAALAGAPLPDGVTIDGQSFAPQLRGEPGKPREWVYVELQGQRYVATKRWKLNARGELFDMKEAPFTEIPVPGNTTDGAAVTARHHLTEVMGSLIGNNGARGKAATLRNE